MRVLITGGRGQLGRALQAYYRGQKGADVYAPERDELDVVRPEQARKVIHDFRPELLIHAGAATNVDACEEAVEEAFRVNALGARHLALIAAIHDIPLVYVSTNYVFDGTKPVPYHEWDRPAPLSIYGQSKLGGEMEVRAHTPRHFIVRTAWLYDADARSRNFVCTMLRLADTTPGPLRGVADQWGQPTYAPDLAAGLAKLVRTQAYGLYHLTNSGGCTWHEWAVELFRLTGRDVTVQPVPASAFPRAATPPTEGRLANWAGAALGIVLPDWRDALARCVAAMRQTSVADAPPTPGAAR